MNPLSPLEQLTELQTSIGYSKEKLSPVALLGLIGESGEVLKEFFESAEGDQVEQSMFNKIAMPLIQSCNAIDEMKKAVRNGVCNLSFDENKIDFEKFDAELADQLYYLNALATARGKTLNDLAAMGIEKVKRKSGQQQ